MKKSELTLEREAKQRTAFMVRMKIFGWAVIFALTGLFILMTAGLALYAAWFLFPREWYAYAFVFAAFWTLAPVLANAGKGFLKEGIFKVLTDLARQELAKKEGK